MWITLKVSYIKSNVHRKTRNFDFDRVSTELKFNLRLFDTIFKQNLTCPLFTSCPGSSDKPHNDDIIFFFFKKKKKTKFYWKDRITFLQISYFADILWPRLDSLKGELWSAGHIFETPPVLKEMSLWISNTKILIKNNIFAQKTILSTFNLV